MISRFIPDYWKNILLTELQQTELGSLLLVVDDFQNWGDVSYTPHGPARAERGLYFNFFVNDVDKLQTMYQTAARNAVHNSVIHAYADIEQYVLNSFERETLPSPDECRVALGIPRIRAYQPERGFCEGIQGLVLCGLIKIGDGIYDPSPRPYQPDCTFGRRGNGAAHYLDP